MSKPNQELFDKVLQRISDDPDSLDMSYWIRRTECGTKACLAGHTVLELGYRPQFRFTDDLKTGVVGKDREIVDVATTARKALGLTMTQAEALFSGGIIAGEDDYVTTCEDLSRRWKYVTTADDTTIDAENPGLV